MKIMEKQYIFVLVIWLTVGYVETKPPITKISSGFYMENVKTSFYENTIPLIYEMTLPDIDSFCNLTNNVPDSSIAAILDQIHELNRDSLHIFPKPYDNFIRSKRGAEFMGDFFNWCCNVAEQKDIDTVYTNQKNLDNFISQIQDQFDKAHKSSVDTNRLFSDHLQQIEQAIRDDENEEEKEFEELAEEEEEIETEIRNLKVTTKALAVGVFQSSLNLAWLGVMEDCRKSEIPSFVVPKERLATDLRRLSNDLSDHGRGLSHSPSLVHKYYKNGLATCIFNEKSVYVTIKVPIRSLKKNFELKKIFSLPFSYNESVCQVDTDINFVAVSNDRIVPITRKMEKTCTPHETSLCLIPRYDSLLNAAFPCLHSILNNNSIASIKEHCPLICTKFIKPMIIQLSGNDFAILAPNQELQLSCPKNSKTQIITAPPIGMIQVYIPCHCFLQLKEEMITPDYPCKIGGKEPIIHHLIPPQYTNLSEPILTNELHFHNFSSILNHNWHHEIPHTNYSTPILPKIHHIPPEVHAATYTSFGTSIIVLILIIFVIFLFCRIFCFLPIIPGARGASIGTLETVDLTMDSLTLFFIVIILLISLSIYWKLTQTLRQKRLILKNTSTQTVSPVKINPKKARGCITPWEAEEREKRRQEIDRLLPPPLTNDRKQSEIPLRTFKRGCYPSYNP